MTIRRASKNLYNMFRVLFKLITAVKIIKPPRNPGKAGKI
jgi:hypothetical protein